MLNGKQHLSKGFVLLGMLCLLLISSIVMTKATTQWSDKVRRDREQELLKVGDTIRLAIGRYYHATPGLIKEYPPTLEALLHDDRFPTPQRYLRKLYGDPVTQREGWGIVVAPNGGVMGINSLSGEQPFKQKNFRPIYQEFEDKKVYADWFFVYVEDYRS
ncbi:MAG TPA: type II secretion system protein [Porticoccus sp.]|nr:type II secretion system protein [Porticoccus sp.]